MKTYEADPSVRQLNAELSTYEILGREKERECFVAYNRTRSARKREELMAMILKSNLRFVLKMAIDYHSITGLPTNDLYSEGKLGLIEAFYKYKYRTGVKFSSFAVWEIRRHMGMFVDRSDMVRIPTLTRKRTLKRLKGQSVNADASIMDAALNALAMPTSIDAPVDSDDPSSPTISAILSDSLNSAATYESEYEQGLVRHTIDECMEYSLDREERDIVSSLFGLNGYEYSASEQAVRYGYSKDIILERKQAALRKLRDNMQLRQVAERM